MLHILIYGVIGVAVVALGIVLFNKMGKKENASPRELEEKMVAACGDPTLINLYHKARNDAERAEIVSFARQAQRPFTDRTDLVGRSQAAAAQPEEAPLAAALFSATGDELLDADLDETLYMSRKERKAAAKAAEAAAKAQLLQAQLQAQAQPAPIAAAPAADPYQDLRAAIDAASARVDAYRADTPATAVLRCPTCGAEAEPGRKFCIICGQPLTTEGNTVPFFAEPAETMPEPVAEPVAATVADEADQLLPAGMLYQEAETLSQPAADYAPEPAATLLEEQPATPAEEPIPGDWLPEQAEPAYAPIAVEEQEAAAAAATAASLLTGMDTASWMQDTDAPSLTEEASAFPPAEDWQPDPAAQRFCTYCGGEVEPGRKFCIHCGMPLDYAVEAGLVAQSAIDAAAQANESQSPYQEPAYEAPAYPEPAYEETTYTEPDYQAPAAEEAQPAEEAPTYEAPAYEAPAYPEPAYEETTYTEPDYQAPAAEEAPTYEAPAYDETIPVEEAPAYEAPSYPEPAYEETTYTEPDYQAPAYDETLPVTEPPADEAQIQEASFYDVPVAPEATAAEEAPAYEAPAYEAPAYDETISVEDVPAYEAPAYDEPMSAYEAPAYEDGASLDASADALFTTAAAVLGHVPEPQAPAYDETLPVEEAPAYEETSAPAAEIKVDIPPVLSLEEILKNLADLDKRLSGGNSEENK